MLMVAMEAQAVTTVESLLYNKRISWELVTENGSLEVVNFSNALAKVNNNSIFMFLKFYISGLGSFGLMMLCVTTFAGDLHWKIVSVYINKMNQVKILFHIYASSFVSL